MIEFDVETTGLQPWSGKHYAFSFQFLDEQGNKDFLLWSPDDRSNEPKIQAWLDRGADEGIRAWNTKFDRAFADSAGFKLPPDGCWHDGMLEAFAIDERESVALKAVAVRLFGEGSDDLQKQVKDWLNKENNRRRKVVRDASKPDVSDELRAEAETLINEEGVAEPANYSDVPLEIMEPYGIEDVVLTQKVCKTFEETTLANAPELWKPIEFERGVLDALYAVEKRGVPAREEEYRKLGQEVALNLEGLYDKVQALATEGDPKIYAKELAKNWGPEGEFVEQSEDGTVTSFIGGAQSLEDFNPSSSAQVLAALKARKADMRFMSEVDGKVSADADNLRTVNDELAAAILEFRAEKKVLSTYVEPMLKRTYVTSLNSYKEPFIAPDGRIHANYRQVGARTARMSCFDPNMQNQPRDDLRLRYNIVADPGFKLVTCDLSNIEMVLFAAFCGKGRLMDALWKGEDVHELTSAMLGFRDRARAGGTYESARQQGKVYNFTMIYGGGLRSIRRYFRVDMATARLYKKRYHDAYPEVSKLQTRIDHALQDEGYVSDKLFSGRRFRVALQDSYKATNYLVQGTAASLLKAALVNLHKDGVPVVALVHDEVVAHVPESDAEDAKELIIRRLTEFANPGQPLHNVVPLKAEGDIVDRWSDAKPLKDENGRKYLFTPKWAGGEKRYVS